MPRKYERKSALPVRGGRKPRDNRPALLIVGILLAAGWGLNEALRAVAATVARLDNTLEKSARERLSSAYRNGNETERGNGVGFPSATADDGCG